MRMAVSRSLRAPKEGGATINSIVLAVGSGLRSGRRLGGANDSPQPACSCNRCHVRGGRRLAKPHPLVLTTHLRWLSSREPRAGQTSGGMCGGPGIRAGWGWDIRTGYDSFERFDFDRVAALGCSLGRRLTLIGRIYLALFRHLLEVRVLIEWYRVGVLRLAGGRPVAVPSESSEGSITRPRRTTTSITNRRELFSVRTR